MSGADPTIRLRVQVDSTSDAGIDALAQRLRSRLGSAVTASLFGGAAGGAAAGGGGARMAAMLAQQRAGEARMNAAMSRMGMGGGGFSALGGEAERSAR